MLNRRAFIGAGPAIAGLAFLWPGAVQAQTRANSGELRIGLAFDPSSFDPHFHNTTPNKSLARSVFEPLVFQDEAQRLVPGLALSWAAINPLTWEFKLRPGVTWHDGTPFTAEDVVFTFARARNVPRSPSGFGGFITGKTVTRIDDLTVRITTEIPAPQTPIDVSTFGIIPARNRDATSDDYNTGRAAIGTGPYRHQEFVRGERIVLARNDNWWAGKAPWERVVMRVLRTDPTRVAALLAGDVDLIETIPTADMARLKATPTINIASSISNRVMYVALDQFRAETPFVKAKDGSAIPNPFRDRRVRLAISHAINRQAICERIMEGEASPAGQYLPREFFGTSQALNVPAFDPDLARKLLVEAGLPNGFRLTMHGPAGRYANDTKMIEAIAQMLNRVGIEASVETLPAANFFSRGSTGGPGGVPEFSAIMAGWGSAAGEASDPLRNIVASFDTASGTGSSNRGRYSNAGVDAALQAALSTIDDTARAALLAKATELAIADMGVIPILFPRNTWAMRKPISMAGRADEFTLPAAMRRD